ncbi:putative F-box protein At1g53550 [Papaver somniferum]|uniref:putative F-box protein At1g53550 n=1 Tax=Papaver somniferum TaxID=3469 RepID=UPI000E6F9738|nr:putative F-box protein At1g53550 [Papaver somniferum]
MGFSMDYFSIVPVDITSEILTRLPMESVLDCKLVCTNWKSLIRQLSFSKVHLYRHNHPAGKLAFRNTTDNKEIFYYFECDENHDEPIQRTKRIKFSSPFSDTMFVGSCNGLICLLDYDYPSFCICNPITREYVLLQYFKRDAEEYDHWVGGFGYLSSTNEYKVVGICKLESGFVEVYIYTLGSGYGWRNVGNFNFELSQRRMDHGIFLNGALYWMDSKLKTILTFDLAKEKFCENLSPPPLKQDNG